MFLFECDARPSHIWYTHSLSSTNPLTLMRLSWADARKSAKAATSGGRAWGGGRGGRRAGDIGEGGRARLGRLAPWRRWAGGIDVAFFDAATWWS